MRRVAVLVASLVFLWVGAASAAAHADLTGFALETGSGGDIVRLTFSDDVAEVGTTVVVLDPNGHAVQADAALVAGNMVTVRLLPLSVAGDYHVNYRVLAQDGHVINGSARFAVTESGIAQEPKVNPVLTASPETSAVTSDDPRFAFWVTGFIMLAALMGALAVWRLRQLSANEQRGQRPADLSAQHWS